MKYFNFNEIMLNKSNFIKLAYRQIIKRIPFLKFEDDFINNYLKKELRNKI
jgi:hypothetical protein